MIPARYHNTIQITFTPLASSDVNKEIDCNSFALGYMSLSDEVSQIISCYLFHFYTNLLIKSHILVLHINIDIMILTVHI